MNNGLLQWLIHTRHADYRQSYTRRPTKTTEIKEGYQPQTDHASAILCHSFFARIGAVVDPVKLFDFDLYAKFGYCAACRVAYARV